MTRARPTPEPDAAAANAVSGRLAWRCRRGMKELDLLLAAWLRNSYPTASHADRAAFAALLELPDPHLQRVLIGGEQPDDQELRRVAAAISGRTA